MRGINPADGTVIGGASSLGRAIVSGSDRASVFDLDWRASHRILPRREGLGEATLTPTVSSFLGDYIHPCSSPSRPSSLLRRFGRA